MYSHTDKEGNCIFCKIADGSICPTGNGVIYEDENYLAWLSPRPNTEGFTVIIPKKHYGSDVLAMPDGDLQEFVLIAKKISKILIDYFDDVGRVGLIMEGTGIDHAHIKLFPMHGTGYMKQGERRQCLSDERRYFKTYEGYIASNEGPDADLERINELAGEIRSK